jgi:flagellar basal-body rod protein FlgG
MTGGLRAAATGLAAQQTRLEALANDVANVNTPGYRSQRVAFQELENGSGTSARVAGRSQAAAPLVPTGEPLDVAVEGPGYFRVRRADGSIALTRDGGLRIDGQGSLVLAGGERLEPPVKLPAGASATDVTIAADGTVAVKGAKVGRIEVFDVPAPDGLLALGGGLFAATAASGGAAPARSPVRQGMREGSNVDVATAMVGMIEAQRGFELASRAVRMQDQLLEIANQIRR